VVLYMISILDSDITNNTSQSGSAFRANNEYK
jgi:hypothetical protein